MKASNAISSRTESPEAPSRSAEYSSSTEERQRFALSGPSAELDPHYHAYRGDLADVALADRLFAPHYAKAVERSVGAGGAALFEAPARAEAAVAELEPGEAFAMLDETGGWAWGYRLCDHRVGYLAAANLEPAGPD